jgi:LemA protein
MILAVIIVVVLAALYVVFMYNRLVTLCNIYRSAYSQIDVQLKRRNDLIPNLVETAKGYLKHERSTLESVTAARSASVQAASQAALHPGQADAMQALSTSENALAAGLQRLYVSIEAYPELKANQVMMNLMEELTTTENRVAFARQAYNDATMFFNTRRAQFPTNIFASMFGFEAAEFFAIQDEAERKAVQVSF